MLRPQIGGLLDYIDFFRLGLKEDISSLSAILPTIVESGLPSHKIVLETYSSDQLGELYHRSFSERSNSASPETLNDWVRWLAADLPDTLLTTLSPSLLASQ